MPERAAIAAFVVALVVGALLTPNLERFAKRHRLLDRPGGPRNLRSHGTPRIGGIGILAAFYVSIAGLVLYDSSLAAIVDRHRGAAYSLLGAGLVMGALGFYDDLRGADAHLKFAVQVGVALTLYQFGYRIDSVSVPGGTVALGILALPVTLVWIVGVTNALNLIDGLDGLAGGVALCALVSNLVVAAVRPEPVMVLCMAALAGAVLGFLFYNFSPASIFMGDSGSLFLGLFLAATSLRTHQKSSAAVSLFVPMLALGLPIADTSLAMVRRALTGRPIFTGDKEHIHHQMLKRGLSDRQAVLALYGTCGVLGGISLALAFTTNPLVGWIVVASSVVGSLSLLRFRFVPRGTSWLQLRRRNRERHAASHEIARRLRGAVSTADVQETAKTFGPAVSATAVRLELAAAAGKPSRAPGILFARYDLPDNLGHLELEWSDGRVEVDRDDELAAERLCRNVADALRRTTRPPVTPTLKPIVTADAFAGWWTEGRPGRRQ